MEQLTRSDLLPLERYEAVRADFRSRVLDYKKAREVRIGTHAVLQFEDRFTVQYQIQEMLRSERLFEPGRVDEQLAAYNPLIPGPGEWKATLLLEFGDPAEREREVARLEGIERRVWVRVGDLEPVHGRPNEHLPPEEAGRPSAVHFLRFPLTEETVETVRRGAPIGVGIDHPDYNTAVDPLPEETRAALATDF